MKQVLVRQYEYVKSSRTVLLQLCASIDPNLFIKEVAGFGRGGSVRNMLVHMNNTYQQWTGNHCLGRQMKLHEYADFPDLQSCISLFKESDLLVDEVLNVFEYRLLQEIERNGKVASPLKIITHVFTHEYHHKGQIASMCRMLGYVPPDTDIIR